MGWPGLAAARVADIRRVTVSPGGRWDAGARCDVTALSPCVPSSGPRLVVGLKWVPAPCWCLLAGKLNRLQQSSSLTHFKRFPTSAGLCRVGLAIRFGFPPPISGSHVFPGLAASLAGWEGSVGPAGPCPATYTSWGSWGLV